MDGRSGIAEDNVFQIHADAPLLDMLRPGGVGARSTMFLGILSSCRP